MTTARELTAAEPNELLVVEGGTDKSPIPTPTSQQLIKEFLAKLHHAIAVAKAS